MAAHTLTFDIGGTHMKAAVVDEAGALISERAMIDTVPEAAPPDVVKSLATMVAPLGAFDRVSVGFPGVVRDGRVLTAPNLGTDKWQGFDLGGALSSALAKPVRVANDADLQGLAVIEGKGVEMVITLGTGFGTGLYQDGRLGPHLELSHHPFRQRETYDEQLGNAARKEVGAERWNKRVEKAIANMRRLTNFDHLYIGGGNARRIAFALASDVSLVSNVAGLQGGPALWRD
ncbi:MAG: ROK family protein [Reyranella sp.]|uniref:ROK family protein n=1 Tax=Reyranella sp. TaxID=1929291 RepID=UPI001AD32A20|nr:ROK family protein [Reyranella sp.]MBN9090032.1 ROK family protein [Reyranella sp.]